jgi:hypothetical protein
MRLMVAQISPIVQAWLILTSPISSLIPIGYSPILPFRFVVYACGEITPMTRGMTFVPLALAGKSDTFVW